MSNKNVHYEKPMRDRAVAENKWLITVDVDGKHLKDDSVTVQGTYDLATAKRILKMAVSLLKPKRKSKKR